MSKYTREEVIEKVTKGESLEGADLSGIDLSNVDFRSKYYGGHCEKSADFSRANLIKANFNGADLRDAKLISADLTGADLYGVVLDGADLRKTILNKAKFSDAILSDTKLDSATICKAILINTDLSGASFNNADLSGANLRNADLCKTNLRDTKLHNADLRDTDISFADLDAADFSGANLSNANLYNTNLRFANLSNTNLSNANLRDVVLKKAVLNYACLENSDLYSADLEGAILKDAKISGVNFSNHIKNPGWKIDDIKCEHIYTCSNTDFLKLSEEEKNKYRRNFKQGEFEARYKTLPKIELIFHEELSSSDHILLTTVIDNINQRLSSVLNFSELKQCLGATVTLTAEKEEILKQAAPLINKIYQKVESFYQQHKLISGELSESLDAIIDKKIKEGSWSGKPEIYIGGTSFGEKNVKLGDYESFVKSLRISCGDNNDEVRIQVPGKESKKYPCHILGFRDSNTGQWKTLIEILKEPSHACYVGKSHDYGSKSKQKTQKSDSELECNEGEQNQQSISEHDHGMSLVEGKQSRQRNTEYDRKLRMLQEINKKLIVFFNKHYFVEIPDKFKLFEKYPGKDSGTYRFVFQVVDGNKNIELGYSNYTTKKEILDYLKKKRDENAPWEDICSDVQDAFVANVDIVEKEILEIFPDKSLKDFAPSFN